MRIVREDQNLMVLKDRNIIAFVVGIIFLLAGIVVIFKPDFFTNQPPLWSGFVGIILGGFVVAVGKITTVHLDKSISKLTFLRKGLIGKSRNEYDLKQIKEVELSVAYHTSSKGGGGHSYHLAFVFNNGEIVQLNPGSSSIIRVMGRQIIPEKTLGARIAGFLGVPFQERRPPTVGETLSAVSSAIQNAAEKEMEKRKEL
jgi:hypothetical protein